MWNFSYLVVVNAESASCCCSAKWMLFEIFFTLLAFQINNFSHFAFIKLELNNHHSQLPPSTHSLESIELIKLYEESRRTISVARVVLINFCSAEWTGIVLAIEPAEQAKLAENVITLVENHRVLIVVMANWACPARSLNLLFCWSCAKRLELGQRKN